MDRAPVRRRRPPLATGRRSAATRPRRSSRSSTRRDRCIAHTSSRSTGVSALPPFGPRRAQHDLARAQRDRRRLELPRTPWRGASAPCGTPPRRGRRGSRRSSSTTGQPTPPSSVPSSSVCDVVLTNPVNAGYGVAAAQGLARAAAPWALLLNPDVVVDPGFVAALAEAAAEAPDDVATLVPDLRFASDRSIVNCRGIEVDDAGIPAEVEAADQSDRCRGATRGVRGKQRCVPASARRRAGGRRSRARLLRLLRGRRSRVAAAPRRLPGAVRSSCCRRARRLGVARRRLTVESLPRRPQPAAAISAERAGHDARASGYGEEWSRSGTALSSPSRAVGSPHGAGEAMPSGCGPTRGSFAGREPRCLSRLSRRWHRASRSRRRCDASVRPGAR